MFISPQRHARLSEQPPGSHAVWMKGACHSRADLKSSGLMNPQAGDRGRPLRHYDRQALV
jgi:hypothetical protein